MFRINIKDMNSHWNYIFVIGTISTSWEEGMSSLGGRMSRGQVFLDAQVF